MDEEYWGLCEGIFGGGRGECDDVEAGGGGVWVRDVFRFDFGGHYHRIDALYEAYEPASLYNGQCCTKCYRKLYMRRITATCAC